MTLHALSPAEIVTLSQQYLARREWEGVRTFVHALYGPVVATATLEILSMYNDFRYDDRAVIHAYDAEGTHLWYDFTQPWWREQGITDDQIAEYREAVTAYEGELHAEQRPGYRDETLAYGPEAIGDYTISFDEPIPLITFFTAATGMRLVERPQARDAISIPYDLLTPPPIAHPRVFIPARP